MDDLITLGFAKEAALSTAVRILQDGCMIVPQEPTREMIRAGMEVSGLDEDAVRRLYATMMENA